MLPALVATNVQLAHLVLRVRVLAHTLKTVIPTPILLSQNRDLGQLLGPGLSLSTSIFSTSVVSHQDILETPIVP